MDDNIPQAFDESIELLRKAKEKKLKKLNKKQESK